MFPTVCYIIQVKYWDRKFDINKIKLIIYPLDFLLTKFIMQRQKLQIYFYLLFQLQPLHPICTKACVKFSPQYSLILFPGCFFLNLNLTTIPPSSSTFLLQDCLLPISPLLVSSLAFSLCSDFCSVLMANPTGKMTQLSFSCSFFFVHFQL